MCHSAHGTIPAITSGRNKNIIIKDLYARFRVVPKLLAGLVLFQFPLAAAALEADVPGVVLDEVPFEVVVSDAPAGAAVEVRLDGQVHTAVADESGAATIPDLVIGSIGRHTLDYVAGAESGTVELRVMPGWVSLLPAFTAIAVALIIRSVVPALLLGIWLGATALQSFTPKGAAIGLLDSFQVFVANAVADVDHAAIILFTMMIGGMVGIITRNGGMMSIVKMVVSRAQTAVGAQVAAWLMGLMIFFDDYANTLVVGNTARPITDQLKISREKLAYIVDSTAAPVVSIALITTWIGYEVSLIDEALQDITELADVPAYAIFLQSIPYSFYPILAIVFVLMVAVTGRDMGPMYTAEVRARKGQVFSVDDDGSGSENSETLEPKPDVPARPLNAFVPIIVLGVYPKPFLGMIESSVATTLEQAGMAAPQHADADYGTLPGGSACEATGGTSAEITACGEPGEHAPAPETQHESGSTGAHR